MNPTTTSIPYIGNQFSEHPDTENLFNSDQNTRYFQIIRFGRKFNVGLVRSHVDDENPKDHWPKTHNQWHYR